MKNKSIAKKLLSVVAATVMACSMAVSASAFTGSPAYGNTTDGTYSYNCIWSTATLNKAGSNKYIDGYALIGRTSNKARRTIAVYTCIGNGSRTSSRFKSTIFNKPTSGPAASSTTLIAKGQAVKYSDGSTVANISKSKASAYGVEATKTWNYSKAITLYGTVEVRYSSGSYAEYTGTNNW